MEQERMLTARVHHYELPRALLDQRRGHRDPIDGSLLMDIDSPVVVVHRQGELQARACNCVAADSAKS